MRKRIIPDPVLPAGSDWLDLGLLTTAEVTSEDSAHPVEAALVPDGGGAGWRAAGPGPQALRLLFDQPTPVQRVRLVFRENEVGRTQEFVLRWSGDGGNSYSEVVRQQYTFSPPGTAEEVEDYRVNLDEVTALELRIVPDVGGGRAFASVERMQVAGARGGASADER